jgi:hypothetical protein
MDCFNFVLCFCKSISLATGRFMQPAYPIPHIWQAAKSLLYHIHIHCPYPKTEVFWPKVLCAVIISSLQAPYHVYHISFI